MNKVLPQITAREISDVLLENWRELPKKMDDHLRRQCISDDLPPLTKRLIDHEFMILLRKRFPDRMIQYTAEDMGSAILRLWKAENRIS